MANKLDEQRLWVALSNVFIDIETDYPDIARVAKDYPIEEVEFAFFERVTPVCFDNLLTPAPSVIWAFDREQLISDIESLIEKRSRQVFLGKCMSAVTGWLIRRFYSNVWREIKAEIEKAKGES